MRFFACIINSSYSSVYGTFYIRRICRDACREENLPACYIRIDVAHFIKKYANFLKDIRLRIKQFYLSALSQLILCRNIETAEELLKGILVISRNETEGETSDNKKTVCEEYKIKLKNIIISESSTEVNIENIDYINDEEDGNSNFNKWTLSMKCKKL